MKFGLGLTACAMALATTTTEARVFMVDDAEGLVAAIVASNATPEADLIDMAPGLYILDQRSSQTTTGLPVIQGDLHVRGNNSELRRYDSRDYELIQVAESGRLHLDRLTLAEGSAGALTNHGTMVLRHVRIVDNSTANRGDAVISNYGELKLNDVMIGYNMVDAASGRAGTLFNRGNVTLVDTQFVDNRVSTRHPEAHLACALINEGRAELRRVSVSGCLAEQLDLASTPRTVLNAEDGALLVEDLRTDDVDLQLYASPLTAALD